MTIPPADDRPLFLVHASVAVVDGDGRVLLVQEEKPASFRKWNLPGGHVDHGEPIADAAARELREEAELDLPLDGLIGAYVGPRSVRFVYRATLVGGGGQPRAGHEILAVRFAPPAEIAAQPDAELVSPASLRAVLRDLWRGRLLPLDAVVSP